MPRRILVLHGPNLELQPAERSLERIDAVLNAKAASMGIELKTFHSNALGSLLDQLVAQREWLEALIVNPTSLGSNAGPLAEAIELLGKPCIEVQLGAEGRVKSALKTKVDKQIHGKGVDGYVLALEALIPASAKAAKKGLPSKLVEKKIEPKKERPAQKTLGPRSVTPVVAKTLGPKPRPELTPPPAKTLGKRAQTHKPLAAINPNLLSRALVRQKIAERLSGRLTPGALATWARSHWQQIQRGSAVESGQRDKLEDILQQLLLSTASKASDDQLIELMTQLGE